MNMNIEMFDEDQERNISAETLKRRAFDAMESERKDTARKIFERKPYDYGACFYIKK